MYFQVDVWASGDLSSAASQFIWHFPVVEYGISSFDELIIEIAKTTWAKRAAPLCVGKADFRDALLLDFLDFLPVQFSSVNF